MRFHYLNLIPTLIHSKVFTDVESNLLKTCYEANLEEMLQSVIELVGEELLTEKEHRRIDYYISGKSTSEIAKIEGVSANALKHTHRKVETMQEILFLQMMKELHPETRDFDLMLFHSYFAKAGIPRRRAFKHLRVDIQGDRPEWIAFTNTKSPQVNKSTEIIQKDYPNPYDLAVDLYLGLEKEMGPLRLRQCEKTERG